jgi:hypothetical protein
MKAFIQATHGFHVRNLLDTRLFALLKARFEIVLIADPADAEFIARDYGGRGVSVESSRIARHRLEPFFAFVRKRIILSPSRALTVSIFSEHERRTRPVTHYLLRSANQLLGRFGFVKRAWLAAERSAIPGSEFDTLLSRHRPDVVITADYGTDPATIRLLRAAARHGVPSVTVVPSFDNLTSKGAIGAPATKIIVWNDTMLREAVELHGIDPKRVAVCGPVQFDVYADPTHWADGTAVWNAHGLDPVRPTIVLGTVTPKYFPYNIEIAELIAEAIESGRLPRDCQVLVRLHPQVVRDPVFGDDLDGYKALSRFPFVKLNVPAVRPWGKLSPPAKNDMAILATILASSAVVVVPASTLAIDAAAVDTPIVGIAFDGRTTKPPELSVARYYHFTHYLPVTRSGAVDVARSPDELIDLLNVALRDRAHNREGRAKLIAALVERHDGAAADRIMREIESLTSGAATASTGDA